MPISRKGSGHRDKPLPIAGAHGWSFEHGAQTIFVLCPPCCAGWSVGRAPCDQRTCKPNRGFLQGKDDHFDRRHDPWGGTYDIWGASSPAILGGIFQAQRASLYRTCPARAVSWHRITSIT